MKRITLSAENELIDQARLVARSQGRTLNDAFREWLLQYTARSRAAQDLNSLMRRFGHIRAGRRLDRDEINER